MDLSSGSKTCRCHDPPRGVGDSIISTTAGLASICTATYMRYLIIPHGSLSLRLSNPVDHFLQEAIPPQRTTPTPLGRSIEALVILLHIYVLAAATLHRSRRRDIYQNAVTGLCVLGVTAWITLLRPPDRGREEVIWLYMASLPIVLAIGLALSAMAHECVATGRLTNRCRPSKVGGLEAATDGL